MFNGVWGPYIEYKSFFDLFCASKRFSIVDLTTAIEISRCSSDYCDVSL